MSLASLLDMGRIPRPGEWSRRRRRLEKIEQDRKAGGVSQQDLAAAAGIDRSWYQRIVADPARASDAVVARLQAAVKAAGASLRADPPHLETRVVYNAALAVICRELDLDIGAVRASDPRRGATASADWMAAATARQLAYYFIHTQLGHTQKRVAEALGLTPAAICLGIRKIEDKRQTDAGLNTAIGELLDRLARDLADQEE